MAAENDDRLGGLFCCFFWQSTVLSSFFFGFCFGLFVAFGWGSD